MLTEYFSDSFSGAEVSNSSLLPILYKRLRIEGSTLRARSLEYQASLISRCVSIAFDSLMDSPESYFSVSSITITSFCFPSFWGEDTMISISFHCPR